MRGDAQPVVGLDGDGTVYSLSISPYFRFTGEQRASIYRALVTGTMAPRGYQPNLMDEMKKALEAAC